MDEEQLIEKAKRGDSQSLARLLQNNYAFLYKYLIKLTLNKAWAEDLAQDTMLKAIENLNRYNGESKFSSWLITIGSRLYIDQLRKRKREKEWQESQKTMRSLQWSFKNSGEWPTILEAMQILSEEQRLTILLKHYYGYSLEDISTLFKIPIGTVKSRLHKGLSKLREEMDDEGSKE